MSDELKRYQEKLGEKFGTIFHGVSYDWANGLVRLNEYRALFGDPANIEFLNTFSGPFMRDVQQVFWRDLLLHITRLTDPVASGKKRTSLFWGSRTFVKTTSCVLGCSLLLILRRKTLNRHVTGVINASVIRI